MNKKTVNLFALILLLCQFANAQSTYESGYIVTTKNDTINGFIRNEMDSELANKISFKKNSSDALVIEYSTNELLAFGFSSGRIFKRMSLTSPKKTTQDTTFVFAKRLVKGKIDFYVWRHKQINSKDLFVVNNESQRKGHLTSPKKNKVKVDGKTYNESDNKYKRSLTYVKNDISLESKNNKNLRYGEKSIGKDIMAFNTNFQDEFPTEKYKEPIEYKYTILAGMPLSFDSIKLHFRVGLFRDKTFTEKSNKFSFLTGIVYQHWSEDETWDNRYQNGTSNYKWQMLNVIPFGIKFQTNTKHVIPYAYFGVGVAVLMMTDYVIENYENVGSETDFVFFPTVNVGVGAKIKVKSNFIITELTPTINGIFFNVGYSF